MLALMTCNRSSWRYVPMLPRTRTCRCIRLSSSRHRTKVFTDFGLPVKGSHLAAVKQNKYKSPSGMSSPSSTPNRLLANSIRRFKDSYRSGGARNCGLWVRLSGQLSVV